MFLYKRGKQAFNVPKDVPTLIALPNITPDHTESYKPKNTSNSKCFWQGYPSGEKCTIGQVSTPPHPCIGVPRCDTLYRVARLFLSGPADKHVLHCAYDMQLLQGNLSTSLKSTSSQRCGQGRRLVFLGGGGQLLPQQGLYCHPLPQGCRGQ